MAFNIVQDGMIIACGLPTYKTAEEYINENIGCKYNITIESDEVEEQ